MKYTFFLIGILFIAIILFGVKQANKSKLTNQENYTVDIHPEEFTNKITNPYLTLPVGRKLTYRSDLENGETTEIEILDEGRIIMGVKTVTYHDIVSVNGEIYEDTKDYLAQDKDGNVWYFGEEVDNYENGELKDHEGSWIAGEDGAQPGIWIKATQTVGETYQQEYYRGYAEDMRTIAEVLDVVKIKLGTYSDCVKTFDWTPLDVDAKENKYYCKGVAAEVLVEDLTTGKRSELVEFSPPI